MRTRLGRWDKLVIKDKIVYKCSECGNIEDKPKEKCCICQAMMLKTDEAGGTKWQTNL